MALAELLAGLRGDPSFMANVVAWRTLPARHAYTAEPPSALHPLLVQTLQRRGIHQLYSHQAQAAELALAGRHVAIVTPTASGKTLCYNLPVFQSLLSQAGARALYLFPTKALAHDQLTEVNAWLEALAANGDPGLRGCAATYDGDTPSAARSRIRQRARLLFTNPDMLHTGILPYHSQWADFFAGLRYVIVDEMHTYRGVFGSHVANVLRRLQRVAAFYGAQPQFVCTSATIANPAELAARLVEQPVTVIDENGAPRGEKHILLYNPPIFDPEHGLRRSATLEVQELAARTTLAGVQTIVFGRSRLTTELLLTYLRERLARAPRPLSDLARAVRGYRGGYLPAERRAIEAGLRRGEVRAVVATNALELGIDIGQLQAAILCGYPGSIASTWQQMGRAGRAQDSALAILVATGDVLDQYVAQHPEFIFERSPEHALINPDNLMLLVDHMRCAAFELPFAAGEPLGASPFTGDVLQLLAEQGDLHAGGGRYYWAGAGYPARAVSLRSAGGDAVLIQAATPTGVAVTTDKVVVIGEVDRPSAQRLVHDGAIYMHEGQSYRVDRLDLEQGLAQVAPLDADFYTQVSSETTVQVLAEHATRESYGAQAAFGDLLVSTQVVGYRRIKRFTHETLGIAALDYAPQLLETSGYWLRVLPATQLALAQAGHWFDATNDYGPNWQEQRQRVRARDGGRCAQCRAAEAPSREHDVHHIVPFRTFGYVPGLNEHYRLANRLENLLLLCRTCHQRLEAGVRVRGGLDGLAYVLSHLAPLHLMCDVRDLGVAIERAPMPRGDWPPAADGNAIAATAGDLPTVYIYEQVAAGLGFSVRLYELHETLLRAAHQLVDGCPCPHGCPACVGPVPEHEEAHLETKRLTLALLTALTTHNPINQSSNPRSHP